MKKLEIFNTEQPLYLLHGMIRANSEGLNETLNISEVFTDENPIKARQRIMNKYQCYVDVFLENKGRIYRSHYLTVLALMDWLKGKTTYDEDFDFDDCDDNFLNIIFIKNPKKQYLGTNDNLHFFDKGLLIHQLAYKSSYDKIKLCLGEEYKFYKQNNFDTGRLAYRINKDSYIREIIVLQTPINYNHFSLEEQNLNWIAPIV